MNLLSEGVEAVGFCYLPGPLERGTLGCNLWSGSTAEGACVTRQELIPKEGDRGCRQTHSALIFNLGCLSQEILRALKQM